MSICHSVYRGINANKIAKVWGQQAIGMYHLHFVEIFLSFFLKLNHQIFCSWFHDGCCECVGSTCINYGINDSRCMKCPDSKEYDLEELPNEDDLDFGENHGSLGEIDKNF